MESLAEKDLNIFDPRTVQRYLDALRNKESFESFEGGIVDVSKRIEEFNKLVSNDLIKKNNAEVLRESFEDLSKTIEDFTGASAQSLLNIFDAIGDKTLDAFDKLSTIGANTLNALDGAFKSFYQNRIDEISLQIEKSNEYYDNEIERAEGDQQTQEELRRDKERLKRY